MAGANHLSLQQVAAIPKEPKDMGQLILNHQNQQHYHQQQNVNRQSLWHQAQNKH